jgi:hypothetical protein
VESIDSCVTWLDRLDKLAWDYLQTHVNYFDSIVGWTWESYSQSIEIHYIGNTWEGCCLSVPLKDSLEWGDNQC